MGCLECWAVPHLHCTLLQVDLIEPSRHLLKQARQNLTKSGSKCVSSRGPVAAHFCLQLLLQIPLGQTEKSGNTQPSAHYEMHHKS